METQTAAKPGRCGVRWGLGGALFGAASWGAAPFLPFGAPPSYGSLEHTFLIMPLVAAPLGLLLLALMVAPGKPWNALPYRGARSLQPAAGLMVLASFFLAPGLGAGALVSGWLVLTVLTAMGARPAQLHHVSGVSRVSLLAAHVFLPVGAAWLLLSRLGLAPPGFAPLTVFLAALHFHFSGFTLQILNGATARQLPAGSSWLPSLHGAHSLAAVAGIPLIALGNVLGLPALKFIGVAAMVFAALGLAVTSTAVALKGGGPARVLLLISAAAVAVAMVFAGVYGVGELSGKQLIGIPQMVVSHGLLNALGFTLCGLLGHLRLHLRGVQVREMGAQGRLVRGES